MLKIVTWCNPSWKTTLKIKVCMGGGGPLWQCSCKLFKIQNSLSNFTTFKFVVVFNSKNKFRSPLTHSALIQPPCSARMPFTSQSICYILLQPAWIKIHRYLKLNPFNLKLWFPPPPPTPHPHLLDKTHFKIVVPLTATIIIMKHIIYISSTISQRRQKMAKHLTILTKFWFLNEAYL